MVKNVVILSDYGYIEGGAGRVAHETALALKERGFRVLFFCAVGPVSETLINSGVEVTCLHQTDILNAKSKLKGALQGIYNRKAKKAFLELLSGLDRTETVIHAHTWTKGLSSSVFAAAKKKNFPVLLTVHDYFLVCPNGGLFNYPKRTICEKKPMSLSCLACNCDARSYPQKLFRVARQRKQNAVLRKCNNLSYAFISEFSKREFLKRYDKIAENKRFFLTNLVNFEKDRFRIPCENNNTFLFIGGLTEVKGVRLFCEAATKAQVKAVVIGQGVLKEELEKAYPNIEFVGWKNKADMLPYLEKTRCLVFPSICYETMGLTPLEMMAYGVPVICSNLSAASEYVSAEFLYDGTSVPALTQKIQEAKAMDIKPVSEEIFSSFDQEKYSKKTYIQNAVNIYKELLQ
ncbi:MAG: glycosyltransferase family 4 protein [Clostridia bacterium]|nr:glycosyltransferase family 4 protein [Clostridia bacterium]